MGRVVDKMKESKIKYELFSIGELVAQENDLSICINKEHIGGLKYLSLFSHAIIIYSKDGISDSTADTMCNGIFLQQTVRVLNINEKSGVIQIDRLKSFRTGAVVYDIKPYFPCEDRVKECTIPKQLQELPQWRQENTRLWVEDNLEAKAASTSPQDIFPIGSITKLNGEYYLDLQENDVQYFDKLQDFSHIKIFWWFHRFDKNQYRRIVECQPPYENAPRTGVFASRSPVRPNPMALTTARILACDREKGKIKVTGLDCFDHTPLMGIMPYIPAYDRVQDFYVPDWLEHWPQWLDDRETDITDNGVVMPESDLDTIQKYTFLNHQKSMVSSGLFEDKENLIPQRQDGIVIKGARQNNLKNVDVMIPYHKMTVITGVSGSGKSSLAFDTIFAESQRRFMDSMSTSDRALYEQIEKPDFDQITGLPPSVAIAQKNIGRNPRSTVGTMTDLYDYLRALFTHIGIRRCPECRRAIIPLKADEIVEILKNLQPNTKLNIAPFQWDKSVNQYIIPKQDGTEYAESIRNLEQGVLDALKSGHGAITITINESDIFIFQTTQMCYHCNRILFEITPATFSFNNPESMCPVCKGLGVKLDVDVDLIISNPDLSILDGASKWWGELRKFQKNPNANWMKCEVLALATAMGIDLEKSWKQLPENFRKQAIFGSDGKKVTLSYSSTNGRSGEITRPVEGAFHAITRLFTENGGDSAKRITEGFMRKKTCDCCHGERLSTEGRLVSIANTRLPETVSMTIEELKEWVDKLPEKLSSSQLQIALPILKELHKRLCDYIQVGVSYLTLDRSIPTLSGGELQRLRLVTQLGSGITNILYVLDEPSAGLHPKDHEKLIKVMRQLRDRGNTVIIVEHDSDTMRAADYIIDLGPGAGMNGGLIVAEGTPERIMEDRASETGEYLSGIKQIACEEFLKSDDVIHEWVRLTGARCNNLKNIDVSFPTGAITCVTGVSGSGKSSMVFQVLYPAISDKINGMTSSCNHYHKLSGAEQLNKIIRVTQSPIGRTPRSNPATYTGVMDEIRNIFAQTVEARQKGYKANKFSFNSKAGQCAACSGEGRKCITMHFMPDIWTQCSVCKGKKFSIEALKIKYKGKSVFDVLEMNVDEALNFFDDQLKVKRILKTLSEVGLGYIKLGQSALTLSGGEAQRIKLAAELSINGTGKTLYLLDEPTTGLHFSDTQNLLMILKKIARAGNTVLIVEHNLDMIKNADWVIDLGPEGGDAGGYIVAQGTPLEVACVEQSYTGNALKKAKVAK